MPKLLSITALVLVAAACAPPPEVQVTGGDPDIEIIAPGDGAEVPVAADGTVSIPVAVYISNFDFAPDEQGAPASDGQGHFHIELDDAYVPPNAEELLFFVQGSDKSAGEFGRIRVFLVDNEHQEVGADDVLEIVYVEPTEDDDTGDTGT